MKMNRKPSKSLKTNPMKSFIIFIYLAVVLIMLGGCTRIENIENLNIPPEIVFNELDGVFSITDSIKISLKNSQKTLQRKTTHRRTSVISRIVRIIIILLLINAYKEPIKSFLDNAYKNVDEVVWIDKLRNKVTEIINHK
jgi:hypothetical protein